MWWCLFLACGAVPSAPSAPPAPSAPAPSAPDVVHDDVAAAVAWIAATPEPQILDVRTPAEFAAGHLAGAVNLDVLSADFAQQIGVTLDTSRPVLVHCQSGRRSRKALPMLQAAGFTSIHHLDGGYAAWSAEQPTVP